MRSARLERKTHETDIRVAISLDGGNISIDTGIGFFNHMLEAFAFHGGFGLEVSAKGDLHVDAHHTVEDIGIVLGKAFRQALGDCKGIERFADVKIPMDEALCEAVVDISGRPFLVFDADMPQPVVGGFDACLAKEFFLAFAQNALVTLHLCYIYGDNSHHIIEALFKATGRVLGKAARVCGDGVASTKGVL